MLQISAELLAMSSDAAVIIKNNKLIFANSAACSMLGADCVGKSVNSLLGDEIAEIQASSYIGEFPVDGKEYIVRVSSADGVKAMFLASVDNNAALISDAFIYSLRNCLLSMEVSLSLLRETAVLTPKQKESLAVISHESYRINRILQNIFIIRAANEKEPPFFPVNMNLSAFLSELIRSANLITDSVEIKFSAPKEMKLYADPALLECLMLNLISNCVIHAKDCKRISITLTPGKERVFISVDDDGCGIAPEELHGVFARYNYSYDTNDMGRGPGLGLTAARTIASLHGGTLLLESRQNIGTAVRVSLSTNPYANVKMTQIMNKYEMNMKGLLTGLASCLNADCFDEKYLD